MRVEEPAAESFLHRLWEKRIAGTRLRTVDGREVEILSPGVRNYDAGPDYRHATIRLDGRLLHGDIEIHPSVDDWNRHGHQRDPAYNNVILHIVTAGCPAGARTVRADGATVPIVDLDQHLPSPAEDLERSHVSAQRPSRQPACWLARQPTEHKLRVVQEAALQRLEMKADRFREERSTDDWDQIAYRGVFEALGYSKNQVPARTLADRLPVVDLWRFTQRLDRAESLSRIQAWLLAASGLLNLTPGNADSTIDQFVQLQRSLWQGCPNRRKVDPLPAAEWKFFRLRPANFPTRRIAAMAQLVVRFRQDGFVARWAQLLALGPRLGRKLSAELERELVVEPFGFWAGRDCFITGKAYRHHNAPQLLGPDRARDIVVNVVLPITLAYADEIGDGTLRAAVVEVYRTYPKHTDNEIVRTMIARLFGDRRRAGRMVRTAAQQQGLIQLYKLGCRIGDCSLCEGIL